MKWDERAIARAISLQLLNRRCVVLVDNCGWTGHECDVLGVTTDLRIIDVEVKISRSDLKADAAKDKWWHHSGWGCDPKRHPRAWPPKVWKHYYALPIEVWRDGMDELLPSTASGILLLRERRGGDLEISCERRARPCLDAYRLKPEEVMDIARLANLRMWEAYNRLAVANSRLAAAAAGAAA